MKQVHQMKLSLKEQEEASDNAKLKVTKNLVMDEAEEEVEEAFTTNTTKGKEVMLFEEIVDEEEESPQNPTEESNNKSQVKCYTCNKFGYSPRNVDMVL